MMNQSETCHNCRWYHADGQCRRHPPAVKADADSAAMAPALNAEGKMTSWQMRFGRIVTTSHWPPVNVDDWCGGFLRR